MVFHNSISFASHNKEVDPRPSSVIQKDYTTTMTMMPNSHQKQKLHSQLIILLTTGLDEMIKNYLWKKALGDVGNRLWNLFGFKKLDDYINVMVWIVNSLVENKKLQRSLSLWRRHAWRLAMTSFSQFKLG
jgi:hypothetical protein